MSVNNTTFYFIYNKIVYCQGDMFRHLLGRNMSRDWHVVFIQSSEIDVPMMVFKPHVYGLVFLHCTREVSGSKLQSETNILLLTFLTPSRKNVRILSTRVPSRGPPACVTRPASTFVNYTYCNITSNLGSRMYNLLWFSHVQTMTRATITAVALRQNGCILLFKMIGLIG